MRSEAAERGIEIRLFGVSSSVCSLIVCHGHGYSCKLLNAYTKDGVSGFCQVRTTLPMEGANRGIANISFTKRGFRGHCKHSVSYPAGVISEIRRERRDRIHHTTEHFFRAQQSFSHQGIRVLNVAGAIEKSSELHQEDISFDGGRSDELCERKQVRRAVDFRKSQSRHFGPEL